MWCGQVEDVVPYELMKLRMLNGSHQALAHPAACLGVPLVHEFLAIPEARRYGAGSRMLVRGPIVGLDQH